MLEQRDRLKHSLKGTDIELLQNEITKSNSLLSTLNIGETELDDLVARARVRLQQLYRARMDGEDAPPLPARLDSEVESSLEEASPEDGGSSSNSVIEVGSPGGGSSPVNKEDMWSGG